MPEPAGDLADVLIIGAGAGGGAAARRLVAAGLKVVALEQGRWIDRSEFRGAEWDWELSAGKRWAAQANVRGAPADYPMDLAECDIQIMNFNGVGGGTILYNAVWPRLMPEHFRERSLYGVAADWPLDYAELLPWYEATDREMGVAGLGGNPVYPPGAEPPNPPLPFGPGAMAVARALNQRGWHWWPDTIAINSVPYGGRHACIQRGTCAQGCGEGAKASTDATHWQPFVAAGGRVITGARVHQVTLDERGLASGAVWADAAGRDHFQPARAVLVAANGIGTPRLLLNSACERFPAGLANSSDQLGRNLMLHPVAAVIGTFPEQLEGWQGQNGSTVQCQQFGLTDRRRGFVGGCKWSLHPLGSGPVAESVLQLAQGDPATYHERVGRRLGHKLMWSIMSEDMPRPENRVVLSADLCDSSGMPAPRVLYRGGADVAANLDFNVAQAEAVFREAGAWEVTSYNPAGQQAHLMGTARMGDDPASSVVDRWGMTHDVPNLGVIDGSVFVTSGPVNPTTTIMALAARTADHLARNFGRIAPEQARRTWLAPLRPTRKTDHAPVAEAAPLAWTDERAAAFAAIADALVPAVSELPAAGQLTRERGTARQAYVARPDLHAALDRALAAGPDGFADLIAADPAAWSAMAMLLSAAYYAVPETGARHGYFGQQPRPAQPDRYPAYIAEGLIDHMLVPGWRERWAAGDPVAA